MVLPAFDPVQCGARLKKARLARGFTQEYVRNYLGYSSRATVSSHEAGERMPRPDEIQRLADLYGVSIDWLFNGFENDDSQLMELARKYEIVLTALASMAPDKANDVMLRIGAVADMFPREDAPEPPTIGDKDGKIKRVRVHHSIRKASEPQELAEAMGCMVGCRFRFATSGRQN